MLKPAILIRNARVYSPDNLGVKSILLVHEKVCAIQDGFSLDAIRSLGLPLIEIDAKGCTVTPGFIDPHEHVAGGSGESGFASQTPTIDIVEMIEAGITTVVGCLGVDTVTQNLTHLLASVKGLNEEGMSAYMWSGGYNVPPSSILEDVRTDILLLHEVIGVGEIALSDKRSSKADPAEVARIVYQAYTSGKLTNKSGVTHFHLGGGSSRMDLLFQILDEYSIEPESIYPTHVEKNPELLKEAARLSKKGVTVDMDTEAEDTLEALEKFQGHGGDLKFMTLSSDASINSPHILTKEFRRAFLSGKWKLEELLPLVTTNTARILKLHHKGKLEPGMDADLVIFDEDFRVRDVINRGALFMKDKKVLVVPKYLKGSKRKFTLVGEKYHED